MTFIDKPRNLGAALVAFLIAFTCIALSAMSSCTTPTTGTVAPSQTEANPSQSEQACRAYSWKDRGVAPQGYMDGMKAAFTVNLCRYRSPEATVAGLIAAGEGEAGLVKQWARLIGLGMRESSGKYCEGRDLSASNTSAETAEAGPFQTSWNSRGVSTRLVDLMHGYQANPTACNLATWARGVNASSKSCQPNYGGSGDGLTFQKLERECPAFAAEWAGVIARRLPAHYGPLVRGEVETRADCVAWLGEIAKGAACE